jgi:hypothetical protein
MINNFELIKSLLHFDSEDDFYHLQIIKRKKDNQGLAGRNNNARCMKTYYISSVEYLEEKREEIIALSTMHNARACINLNRRSFEKIAYQTLIKITGQIMSKDFKSARRAYDSVCGAYSNEPHKKWIIDVDDINYDNPKDSLFYITINNFLHDLQPIGNKILCKIKTKSGFHIITSPFNVMEFSKKYDLDIHKDNPTILYIP